MPDDVAPWYTNSWDLLVLENALDDDRTWYQQPEISVGADTICVHSKATHCRKSLAHRNLEQICHLRALLRTNHLWVWQNLRLSVNRSKTHTLRNHINSTSEGAQLPITKIRQPISLSPPKAALLSQKLLTSCLSRQLRTNQCKDVKCVSSYHTGSEAHLLGWMTMDEAHTMSESGIADRLDWTYPYVVHTVLPGNKPPSQTLKLAPQKSVPVQNYRKLMRVTSTYTHLIFFVQV